MTKIIIQNELLLQRRSTSKKTHPNCWDISGAEHIKAGESVVDGAIRELKEELGVEAEEKDLQYIATIKSIKNPKNMEFQYVYLLNCNKEIDNFKEEEKGYFLPFKKDTYLSIVNNPINDGEIYGAFIDNKMIAWIFLSVSNRMKELKQMIPNIKGNCADIDRFIGCLRNSPVIKTYTVKSDLFTKIFHIWYN